MKKIELIFVGIIFFLLSCIYLFPIFQGLIVLPLDLLISQYGPWYSPGTILLKNPYMQDSIIQMFPWRHLVFDSLTHGIIPFWNPYQFMGAPFMASLKPLIFYPANIFYIFGEIWSWNLLLLSQIFMSLIFFYALMRDFKLAKSASFLSALSFALSTLMIGVLEFGSEGHVILWIPLFLLFAKRFIDLNKGKYLFLLSIVIALSILAGQLQYSAYGLILDHIFIVFYGLHNKIPFNNYVRLTLAIILGIGLTTFLLVPAIELFKNSHRGLIDNASVFSSGLLKPIQLLRLFSPDYFGSPIYKNLTIGYIETSGYFGIIPLFFAFYAFFCAHKQKLVKFFIAVFIVSVVFSSQYIGNILYLFKIPLITSGSGGRLFMLTLMSGSVLAGFGLSAFIEEKSRKKLLVVLLIFLLTLILVFFGKAIFLKQINLIMDFIHDIKFTLIVSFAFLFFGLLYTLFKNKIKNSKFIFVFIVLVLTFVDLFSFGYRYLTFSNTKFFYPQTKTVDFLNTYSKTNLARSYGISEPEIQTYLKLYSLETYNPLYILRNANLLQGMQGKTNEKLSIENKYLLSKQEKLKNILDFFGADLVIVGKDVNPSIDYFLTQKYQNNFTKLYGDEKYSVYKNNSAYKRFYLVHEYQVIKDNKQVLEKISSQPQNYKDKIILSEEPKVILEPGLGTVRLVNEDINNQKFVIDSQKPALFYISDTYYPGWEAKVNNTKTKIYQANYNFRAVLVPKGKSVLEFKYLPTNFNISILISLSCLFLLTIISFYWDKIKKISK